MCVCIMRLQFIVCLQFMLMITKNNENIEIILLECNLVICLYHILHVILSFLSFSI